MHGSINSATCRPSHTIRFRVFGFSGFRRKQGDGFIAALISVWISSIKHNLLEMEISGHPIIDIVLPTYRMEPEENEK